MKISEVIEKLEDLKKEHGDIDVFCEESQDSYFEYHPIGKNGIKFINEKYFKTGIYLTSEA